MPWQLLLPGRCLLLADVGACRCQLKRSAEPLEPRQLDKFIDDASVNLAGAPVAQQVRDARQFGSKGVSSKR